MIFDNLKINDTIFVLSEINSAKPLVAKKLKVLNKREKNSIIYFTLEDGVTFRIFANSLLDTVGNGKKMWFSTIKEGIERVGCRIDSRRITSRQEKINSIVEKISSEPLSNSEVDNLTKKVNGLIKEIAKIAASELEYE